MSSIYIEVRVSEAGLSSERSEMIVLTTDSHEKAVVSVLAQALYHDAKEGLISNFAKKGKISSKEKNS